MNHHQDLLEILEILQNCKPKGNKQLPDPRYEELYNKYSLSIPKENIPAFGNTFRLTVPNNTIMFSISDETIGVYLDVNKDTKGSPSTSTCKQILGNRVGHYYDYRCSHEIAVEFISEVMDKFSSYDDDVKMVDLRKQLKKFINEY